MSVECNPIVSWPNTIHPYQETHILDLFNNLRVTRAVGSVRLSGLMPEVWPTGCRYTFHSQWLNLTSANGSVSAAAPSYQTCWHGHGLELQTIQHKTTRPSDNWWKNFTMLCRLLWNVVCFASLIKKYMTVSVVIDPGATWTSEFGNW